MIACTGVKTEDGAITEPIETSETVSNETETPSHPLNSLVGNWVADSIDAGVKVSLTISADSTFNMKMATIDQSGTWSVIDDSTIVINHEKLKKGQTWRVRNLGSNTVGICWNPESKNPKTIPFKR